MAVADQLTAKALRDVARLERALRALLARYDELATAVKAGDEAKVKELVDAHFLKGDGNG